MAKGDIRLHPKHGLNPTIPVCSWCKEDTGEVALLGAAYKGEAPMRMILDDQPCDKCRAQMALGITIIETSTGEMKGRTGHWWVMKEEAVRRMCEEPMLSTILEKRAFMVKPEMAKEMGLYGEEVN